MLDWTTCGSPIARRNGEELVMLARRQDGEGRDAATVGKSLAAPPSAAPRAPNRRAVAADAVRKAPSTRAPARGGAAERDGGTLAAPAETDTHGLRPLRTWRNWQTRET